MKVCRLKTLALILWGAILGLCVLFGVTAFANQEVRSMFLPSPFQPGGTPSLVALPPGVTMTPSPAVYYLPSATARAATSMPVTTTPTPGAVLPVLQYSLTIPADMDPLTGLKPANADVLNRRPLAVKVSTFPRGIVRPYQSGLTRADVVYEYYIEDGLTRFIAVYYSKDAERAGPVRSGRYFDEYIMRMYHAALVFANADERVEKHLLESDLMHLLFLPRDDNCPPLCRDTTIEGYNNVFVNTAGVGPKLSDNSHQDVRASLFGALLYPMSVLPIKRVYTHYSVYSYNYWEYDPDNFNYKRYSDAADATSLAQDEVYAPHIDHLTGAQLTADNVVVLFVPHIFHNEYDRADQLIDINLTGTGDAYLFREGNMLKVKWVRDLVDQPIQLRDDNDHLVPLKPGVTYYQVIDPESTLKQTGENMEFFFYTPLRKVTPTPTPYGWNPTPTPRKSQKTPQK
ncbi:MAG TPA: DUF3048 domain-containing protein [Anaerolineales bacterium]|jgi:hypothetical protein